MDTSLIMLCAQVALAFLNLILLVALLSRRRGGAGREEMEALRSSVEGRLDAITAENRRQMDAILARSDKLAETIERNMGAMRRENNEQIDRMRRTVDEQLKETLETRLTESFSQVSKQLESVYAGLGEMKALAKDVGDLSKILSNVKNRGTWGEVQAEAILSDLLSPDQWEKNFAPKPRSQERVEFAIRLPGKEEGRNVWLPIDSKFPKEAWERVQEASAGGNAEELSKARAELKARVFSMARDIRDKYITPPRTTDFAILFLPAESVYAEVLSIPGFAEELQNTCRVTLAGPTTLSALVNSLQMGFRSLAVEKRSHEVWKLFSRMKTQFMSFSKSVEEADRSLGHAANKLRDVSDRTAKLSARLGAIELPEAGEAETPDTDSNRLTDE